MKSPWASSLFSFLFIFIHHRKNYNYTVFTVCSCFFGCCFLFVFSSFFKHQGGVPPNFAVLDNKDHSFIHSFTFRETRYLRCWWGSHGGKRKWAAWPRRREATWGGGSASALRWRCVYLPSLGGLSQTASSETTLFKWFKKRQLRSDSGPAFTQPNDHADALTQSWTFMVLRGVSVSGPITALAAASPQQKVTISGRSKSGPGGGRKEGRQDGRGP